MKLSEALFVPALHMSWEWKATEFNLLQDGKKVWSSLDTEDGGCAPSWDYPGANSIARLLRNYINTPVEDLKAKITDHITKLGFYEKKVTNNFNKLVRIMLAADRRIGKNVLSLWLFVEPDHMIRNIIGRRL